jgi:hypothetical protein
MATSDNPSINPFLLKGMPRQWYFHFAPGDSILGSRDGGIQTMMKGSDIPIKQFLFLF